MKQQKYKCLNGIKGLAAIEIACIYHLATINYPYQSGLPFENIFPFSWCYKNGSIFVELFFILSGMLAFHVYSEEIAGGGNIYTVYKEEGSADISAYVGDAGYNRGLRPVVRMSAQSYILYQRAA